MSRRISFPRLSIFGGSADTTSISSTKVPQPPSPLPSASMFSTFVPKQVAPAPAALPAPRAPHPWLWQCCSCSMVYKLACTRRCLLCSHKYCTAITPPSSRRGKKRRRGVNCRAEFDYNGWADWNEWRRSTTAAQKSSKSSARLNVEERRRTRERRFFEREHNCWKDCEYPSECHHEHYRIAQSIRLGLYDVTEDKEEEDDDLLASRGWSADELELNEAIPVEEVGDDEPRSPTSPKSPLSQTSFFFDDPAQTAQWAYGASSLDSDSLYDLLEEDEEMMPVELDGASRTLSVRNGDERMDECDSDDESSSDGGRSMSVSSDESPVDIPASFMGGDTTAEEDEEALLKELMRTRSAFLREAIPS